MRFRFLLLILYLVFLFVLCRILDIASGAYFTSIADLDPSTLRMKQLKEVLNNRGISYSGVVEKNELVELVRSSGKTSTEELNDAMFPSKVLTDTTNFTSGSQFIEKVESTKDNVWLIQVMANDLQTSLLCEQTWEDIKLRTSEFGIRNGVFKCSLDKRLCDDKGWTSSRLILAIPRRNWAKKTIVVHHLLPSTSAAVLQWIQRYLALGVQEIQTNEELEQWMIPADNSKKSEIRIALFSFLKSCPMFLSALAAKFNGRVKFATVNLTSVKSYKMYVYQNDLPSYVVITYENIFSYGVQRGECYNFKSMELYLKTFVPEMNDIFFWSLLLINALIGFELFYMYNDFWKHIFLYVIRVVKYKFLHYMLWSCLLPLYQLPFMMTFSEMALTDLRSISELNIAAILRNDYKRFYSNTFLFSTFGFFVIMSGYLFKNFKWLKGEVVCDSREEKVDIDSEEDTFFSTFRSLSTSERISLENIDEEGEIRNLIQRLTTPDFLSEPMISTDYIKDLPMWKYQGWCESDDEIAEKKKDAISSVNATLLNANKSSVPELQPFSLSTNSIFGSSSQRDCSISLQNDSLHEYLTHPRISGHNCLIYQKSLSQEQDVTKAPKGMLKCSSCCICREDYIYGECLCGLPCGHNFHMQCIVNWLNTGSCPNCRCPSYKVKNHFPHLLVEETNFNNCSKNWFLLLGLITTVIIYFISFKYFGT